MAVAEELHQVQSDEIGLERSPNLALEDFTRHIFQRNLGGFPALELSLITIIHLLNDERNPADGRFRQAEF